MHLTFGIHLTFDWHIMCTCDLGLHLLKVAQNQIIAQLNELFFSDFNFCVEMWEK